MKYIACRVAAKMDMNQESSTCCALDPKLAPWWSVGYRRCVWAGRDLDKYLAPEFSSLGEWNGTG